MGWRGRIVVAILNRMGGEFKVEVVEMLQRMRARWRGARGVCSSPMKLGNVRQPATARSPVANEEMQHEKAWASMALSGSRNSITY